MKTIETLGESSEDLQEKVNREHENNRLEEYWKGIIEECLLNLLTKYHFKQEELKEDEAEYEHLRIELLIVSEKIQEKKNKINSLSSHWSEDSEDQDLHTNDAQNFSANDNIVDIENEIENDLYETTSTINIVDNETQIEIDLYETTSTTNIVRRRRRYERDNTYTEVHSHHNTDNYLATMASSISEAQDDLYDNTNPNQSDNGEDSEPSDDDVSKFFIIIVA
ncbi:31071_t:CDS:2 [Gigaspora margarita]|uniref:31071_t:CDS:1 n=1 Tax=Gigaspora margarita TaxID=4874 RepID=A0ABN7VRE5_GIGMA|nr:31071_t:CDS:2 [Gigaspora margarita]